MKKEKISEEYAAKSVIKNTLESVEENWPETYKQLHKINENFILEGEDLELGEFYLFIAVVALDSRALQNLFPNEQAERIMKYIRESLSLFEGLPIESFDDFILCFDDAIKEKEDPIGGLSAKLLQKVLGERLKKFSVSGFISPILMIQISALLVSYSGKWKLIKDNFTLIND